MRFQLIKASHAYFFTNVWIFPPAVNERQHLQETLVVSTGRPGLTNHHTLTCTPRTWLSAWTSRLTSRSRPMTARHLRRGLSGWPRARCRVLTVSLTYSKTVSDVFFLFVQSEFIANYFPCCSRCRGSWCRNLSNLHGFSPTASWRRVKCC